MRRLASIALGLLALGVMSCHSPATTGGWHGPETVGAIDTPLVTEASGLAASRRADNLFWTHNDSGGIPVVYAIDGTGKLLGAVRVKGIDNVDWEDIASFELDGQAYLLIADTGDNYGRRTDCALYVIKEPDPAALRPGSELSADILWKVPVRYPEGPRDCESVAVDITERAVYLISKRTNPAFAYRLPLHPPLVAPVAQPVGPLHGIPWPTGPMSLLKIPTGMYRAEPCGLDITPDGRTAAVLTYGEVYLYHRGDGQTWAQAFASDPIALASHGLFQAEDICFTRDSRALLVTTEGTPAPLLRYRRLP